MDPSATPLNHVDEEYDAVIVGGGIVGAGIFRDLSLHGLKCLIIDKKDFSSQTSNRSSKMLHGGIRYLEKMDFSLVWEALHEKNLWLKLAPHLCEERPFYLPIYKESAKPLWMIKIGLALYDFLSSFQNTPHKILGKDETLKQLKGVKETGLIGAGLYHDAIVDDGKLGLEVIYDGLKNQKCHALNYVEIKNFVHGPTCKVYLKDSLNPEIKKTIRAKELIFATGPFTDLCLSRMSPIKWNPTLLPSKGIHLWVKKDSIPLNNSMVLNTKDGRIIFVIPWVDAILVGTTESPVKGDFFDLKATQEDINYLLKNLKEYFPHAPLSEKDIISTFAGVRPLIREGNSEDLGDTAREHKMFQPFGNVYVIAGGKYTTFRVMGQEISRIIVERRNETYDCHKTNRPLRQKSRITSFNSELKIQKEDLEYILENELVRTPEDLIKRRLGLNLKNPEFSAEALESLKSMLIPLLEKSFGKNFRENGLANLF